MRSQVDSGRSYYHNSLLGLSQWEPPQWSYCRGLLAALRSASYPATDPTQPYTPLQQRLQIMRDARMRKSRVCNYITALSGAKRFSATTDAVDPKRKASRADRRASSLEERAAAAVAEGRQAVPASASGREQERQSSRDTPPQDKSPPPSRPALP